MPFTEANSKAQSIDWVEGDSSGKIGVAVEGISFSNKTKYVMESFYSSGLLRPHGHCAARVKEIRIYFSARNQLSTLVS